MKKLTAFGKFSRKLRIDHGEILKDMADRLGVTSAYLSAVETGKRNVPQEWVSILSEEYSLSQDERYMLKNAYSQSIVQVKMDLSQNSPMQRETAMVFARELKNISDDDLKPILERLRGYSRKRRDD